MAKKRKPHIQTDENDTGIYRKVNRIASTPKGMEAILNDFAESHNRAFDLPKRLDDTEARLKRIVATPAASLPADSREDAKAGLAHIKCILHHESTGDIQNAIVEAIELGHALERLGVRPFEQFVKYGRTVAAKNVKLQEARKRTPAENEERCKEARKLFDELLEATPHMKRTTAYKRVGELMKLSGRSIANCIAPRSRRKK